MEMLIVTARQRVRLAQMAELEESEGRRTRLGMDSRMARGQRGIVVSILTIVAMSSLDIVVWIGPLFAVEGQGPPVVTLVFVVVFVICLLTASFISIWTSLNPPPANAPSYGLIIVLALVIGFGLVFLHPTVPR